MRTVGIVSPGAMGSAVASALIRGGARVIATLDKRSERTARLAEGTGLEFLPDLEAVVEASDVYAALSQTSFARRHPEELGSDPALKDVLGELAPLEEPL